MARGFMAPSRPLDALYDPIYSVSSTAPGTNGASSRPKALAKSADSGTTTSTSTQISGSDRPKFFRRPVLPHLQTESPEVVLAPVPIAPAVMKQLQAIEEETRTKSVAVQTVYRDSEAQTDPYTPDYTLPPGAATPEIVSLSHLHFNAGLPIGPAEMEMIERNRHKAAFDKSLPPMTDEASFQLRKHMMEQQELTEWRFREQEIDLLHEKRIACLQKALMERDKENEFLSEQRLEALRQKLVHAKENALERLQQQKVAKLRKLTKQRMLVQTSFSPKKVLQRDIIQQYADQASKVYAPLTRDGVQNAQAKNNMLHLQQVIMQQLETKDALKEPKNLASILELEQSLPKKYATNAAIIWKPKTKDKTSGGNHGKSAKDRKQEAIEAHLLKMEAIIKKAHEQRDATAASSSLMAPTSPTSGKDEHHHARGKASSAMTATSPAAHGPGHTSSTGSLSKRKMLQQAALGRPPTPIYANESINDAMEGLVVESIQFLQKLLRGRAVQNMMYEGKQRRAELIAELRASEIPRVTVPTTNEALHDQEQNRIIATVYARAEGEVISELLDRLHKELDRAKQIATTRQFIAIAMEERRRREVEEGGRRQAEDLLRKREDELFRRVEQIHQETAHGFVAQLVAETIQEASHTSALEELNVQSNGFGAIMTRVEDPKPSDEMIVKELVASFLLPQVERQRVQDLVAREEQGYVNAAHAIVHDLVSGSLSSSRGANNFKME